MQSPGYAYLGPVQQAPSAYHAPKFHSPGRKRDVQISHTVCINDLGAVSRSVLGIVGMFLKCKFPNTSQGPQQDS